MKRRLLLWSGLGAVALLLALGAWIVSLPAAPSAAAAPAISTQEAQALVAALKPPRRPGRPLIAILGASEGSEVTDYLTPYGILRRADVADVVALGTKPGPVSLYPGFKVAPDATVAAFDSAHPDGADYVIVPAMRHADDAAALQWIRRQADKGAIVVGVCVGATVVANAGLLDGRRATTHWYSVKAMLKAHPTIRYVADRRLVVDGKVATTTGITASMPMSLTLIEAIAGRDKALAVARDLGLDHWDARHASGAFKFTRPFALTAMGNRLAFWDRETLGVELIPGVDDVSLALMVDAWSRTYRARAVTFAPSAAPVTTRSGLRIFPAEVAADWPAKRRLPAIGDLPPAKALDRNLQEIGARYGARTADLVAMQLEYPRKSPS